MGSKIGTIFKALGNKILNAVIAEMPLDVAIQYVRDCEEAAADGRLALAQAKGRYLHTKAETDKAEARAEEVANGIKRLYADGVLTDDEQRAADVLMPRLVELEQTKIPQLKRRLDVQEQTFTSMQASMTKLEDKISEARERVRTLQSQLAEAEELNAAAEALEDMEAALGTGIDSSIDSLGESAAVGVEAARARFESATSGSSTNDQTVDDLLRASYQSDRLAQLKAEALAGRETAAS